MRLRAEKEESHSFGVLLRCLASWSLQFLPPSLLLQFELRDEALRESREETKAAKAEFHEYKA